jgi:hypothetical protein
VSKDFLWIKWIVNAIYPPCTELNTTRIYWAKSRQGFVISIEIKCSNFGVSSNWLKWLCDSSLETELLSEFILQMALLFDLLKQFIVCQRDFIKHVAYDIIVVFTIFVTLWLKSLE